MLAGIILMASGISGAGPTAYDSTITLRHLVEQVIPRYRDAFYRGLLEVAKGPTASGCARRPRHCGSPSAAPGSI